MAGVDAAGDIPIGGPRRAGRPPSLGPDQLDRVAEMVRARPNASLDELGEQIEAELGVGLHRATLARYLLRLGFERVLPPTSKEAKVEDAAREAEAVVEDPGSEGVAQRYGYGPEHRVKAPEAAYLYGLSDAEWELVRDIFEDKVRGVPRKYERRAMVDAMCYAVRGGVPWRMLPKDFPPWHMVFKTFKRWAAQGRFEVMYDRLREKWRERVGRSADPTAAVIDTQSVKTSAQGGPKGFDGAKKVKGRKRHLLTDTLGLILVVLIQTACTQDRDGADAVVAAGLAKIPTITKVFADEGYAGQCRKRLQAAHPGLAVEIVRRPGNRSVGRRLEPQLELPIPEVTRAFVPLPRRWVIERTNAWNDRPRRLAKDQDRTLQSSTAWIWLTEARRLLRRVVAEPA